jgi:hypothetical protein
MIPKVANMLLLALALAATPAIAQVNPGSSPLSGAKGGTNNSFMQFSGPASSLKTYTLPNATGTLAMLSQIQTWTGSNTFNPASGNALTIGTLANSYAKGFDITQSSPTSGSTAGPLFYNNIDINHQANVTGTSQAGGLHVKMNLGGANMAGAGPQMGGYFEMLDSIAGSAVVSDKIGVAGSCSVSISDTAGGGCYGSNNYAGVTGTGSIARLVGHESDIEIRSGGAATYRYAFSAVNETLGVGTASTLDAAFIVGNIGNNTGAFKNGFVLSKSLGQNPLQTNGSVFFADAAMTVANVLDFGNLTVTGNIWNFTNTTMTADGLMTAQDVKVTGGPATVSAGQGTIGSSANSGLIMQGNGAIFDFILENKNGTAVCSNATGTTTLACNTVTLTNALGVASGGTGDTGTAWTSFTPALSCGTATFTVNSATRKTLGKTTWAQIDYSITAIGTCTTQGVTFTLPNTAQTSGSLNGQETANSTSSVSCMVVASSATASCRRALNVAAAVNDRVVVSGVYQNQ